MTTQKPVKGISRFEFLVLSINNVNQTAELEMKLRDEPILTINEDLSILPKCFHHESSDGYVTITEYEDGSFKANYEVPKVDMEKVREFLKRYGHKLPK